ALAVADRRDEVDRAARQLGATLGGAAGFEREFSFRIARRQRVEVGAAKGERRVVAVDRRDFRDHEAAAMVASGGGGDEVAAANAVLANQVGSYVCVAAVGEVAVDGAANEAGVTRGVEPAVRRSIGDDDRRWARHDLVLAGVSAALSGPLASAPVAAPATAAALLVVVVVALAAVIVVVVVVLVRLIRLAVVESRVLGWRVALAAILAARRCRTAVVPCVA